MKLLSKIPLALGVAAVAAGASVFLPAPEAKAACVDAAPPCSKFGPGTPSSPIFSFTGSSTLGPGEVFDGVRVGFRVSNPTVTAIGLPISISGITLTGPGISGSKVFNDVTLNAINNSTTGYTWATFGTAPNTQAVLDTFLNSVTFGNAGPLLSFNISSSTLPYGTKIFGRISYGNNYNIVANQFDGDTLLGTSSTTAVEVPGPLPILGAASAFGFSRSIRRRIKASESA